MKLTTEELKVAEDGGKAFMRGAPPMNPESDENLRRWWDAGYYLMSLKSEGEIND